MDDKVTFLTNKNFNILNIIEVLENALPIIEDKDKEILLTLISDFKSGDLSLLSPQEIHFLNNNPIDVWPSYLTYRYKFIKYPIKRIVTDFPIYLLIEPVSACNLRCVMCFQIDDSFSSNKNFMGKMELELFKKVIDQAYEGGTKAITLASRGEPTLHPQIGDMIEYCTGKFYEFKINTNATRLNEKLIHQILKSDVTDLVFSVDSYEKKQYESIRVGGVFESVLNNIKKFHDIRKEHYPKSRCATRISGVRVDKNMDIGEFKNFWEQIVDHVILVDMEQRWDTYSNPIELGNPASCKYLWERLYVWYDGICNPCDADYKSELSPGSIKENSIREIWNGEKLTKLRNAHMNGMRNTCYPCDRCPNS